MWSLAVFLAIASFLAVGYVNQNLTYYEKGMEEVTEAGFVEKQIEVEGHWANYAEGPDNGVPLLLIHGQGAKWQDYMRVLPDLATTYHVYAVDVYGHGNSASIPAEDYTNVRIGTLIARFMEEAIGEPAVVSGHSSGGLIATWIAANRPELVRGLVLEDPPFFSSIMPRAEKTAGGDLARITHDFVSQEEESDFQRYYVQRSNYFSFFGGLEQAIVDYSIGYIEDHPREPLEIFFLPPNVNIYFQGLAVYDPRFGAAWYDNSWYEGFDTEENLAAITVPTVLIHADYWYEHHGSYYNEEGVLMAATDGEDLARVRSLLDGVEVVEIDSGHLVHFERPEEYTRVLLDFASRVA
ncbi:Pimeloyl-ACP methyl ester carboxylesterase [Marinactinospora thermotolerans DSM 45154]|uniref:Pimeloyl-ACP methyl ester carboxylesterase n=1 Tax=Marinactinospora thermotolerans DSM 45154 TaxID=1122192 RepID=A0A1T4PH76_9ACTN|nr:alpha/beta hydrolase [Marinactinospora thermotolerans]SJZ90859.1 Pimeloyl-ACP methyl ester carboxylesterase [Marinactinospora thermotolerans DSM 45154]